MRVLGIKIDDVSSGDVINRVTTWLGRSGEMPKLIATVGPEFLLTAQEDQEFKDILNSADLGVPEGFGLQLYCGVKNRLPGTDLMLRLCQEAANKGWTIGLLGGNEGIANRTMSQLQRQFNNLRVKFTLDGKEADNIISLVNSNNQSKARRAKGNRQRPVDLLFVALGHPKQEKLLNKLIEANPTAPINFRVGMGVGGAFDQISGNIPRPPKWLQELGFEWIFRIFVERPGKRLQRLKRIFKATIIFPLILLKTKLVKPVV